MEIKDGDYFSYWWKEGRGPSTDPYWCRDRRCVARTNSEGVVELIDTYNYWEYDNPEEILFHRKGLVREYSRYVDEDKFDIEFICNLNDVKLIKEWEKEDYDKIYNLSYQVGYKKLFAIDKDAKPSKAAILKKLKRKLEEAEYKVNSGNWDISSITKEIEELGNER